MPSIELLLEQNKEWARKATAEDPDYLLKLSRLQTPEYLWIGCSDSRITPVNSLGLLPGEMFVHRNISNLVVHTDLNCLSVMQFAVEALKVKHIIICGHYGCGGINAALQNVRFGLIETWLHHIQDLRRKHRRILDGLDAETLSDKLSEINIIEQVINAGETSIVQSAWKAGHSVAVHGWIYRINDGIYRDIGVSINSLEQLETLREQVDSGEEFKVNI